MAGYNFLAPQVPFGATQAALNQQDLETPTSMDDIIEQEWLRHNLMQKAQQQGAQGQQPQQTPQPPRTSAHPEKQGNPGEIVDRTNYDNLLGRVNAHGLQSLQQQQQGIGDLQAQLQMALQANQPQLDLSPLAALTDSWTGSHLQQGYTKPDFDKQQGNIQSLQQALQKGRNDLSERDVDLLKSQLMQQQHADESMQREKDRQTQWRIAQQNHADNAAFRNDKLGDDRLSHAMDTYNKDPQVQDANKSLDEASKTQDLLAQARSGNPVARKAAQMTLAKSINPQRLTETEMGPFGGSDAVSAKISQALSNAEGNGLTEENFKFLSDINNSLTAKAKEQHDRAALTHAKQYSKMSGKDVGSAYGDITGGKPLPSASSGNSSGPFGSSVTQDGHTYNWNPSTGKYE